MLVIFFLSVCFQDIAACWLCILWIDLILLIFFFFFLLFFVTGFATVKFCCCLTKFEAVFCQPLTWMCMVKQIRNSGKTRSRVSGLRFMRWCWTLYNRYHATLSCFCMLSPQCLESYTSRLLYLSVVTIISMRQKKQEVCSIAFWVRTTCFYYVIEISWR